ncbi:MAG: alkaline phosphatase family protein [Candidatus Eisenbacteria bacterium]
MTIRRAALVVLLVASVVLLIIVIGWEPDARVPAGPSTGLKVIVVGVDGMDWFLMRKLLEEGALPSITSILKRGITGEMAAELPPVPENGWTALARGRGLTGDERARLASEDGRLFGLAPELAELVVRSGGTALSVGWPASWPVGDAEGLVVAPYRPEAPVHETGLPAAIMRGDTRFCSEEVADRVAGIVARSESACEEEFRRLIFDGDADESGWREHLLAARWAFLSDLTTINVAASLMADEEPDLTMVCFGGMDAIGHRFLAPAMPSFFAETPPEYERYESVLTNYFVFIDSCIERLRRLTDEDTVFIICSAYGTHPSLDTPTISGAHTSGPPGVMILRGTNIARRPRAVSLSGEDLTPTVLALLGLAIPTDMDGRVVQEVLPARLLASHPPQYSGSIRPEGTDPTPSELMAADAAVVERISRLRDGMAR